ncbi:MAG: class A beta-lactamase [Sphingomonadaceae bacterium]|nr:class A beta-lactamase [Sphingomonadaceae bacterium]
MSRSCRSGIQAEVDLAALEQRLGGRLGVALLGAEGATLLSHRANERFAMCSTFKLALAAAILDVEEEGGLSPDEVVTFGRDDMVPYSPVVEPLLAEGRVTLGQLTEAIVTISDNTAANLLLARVDGPEGLTAFIRANGDAVTRLDRTEPTLNENVPGDPRDTTSPAAMAALTRRLIEGDTLSETNRGRLFDWTVASTTGLQRIRAGLPPEWPVGDKTGSCGTAYNDIAIIRAPGRDTAILTVYIDRPTAEEDAVFAAMAQVGRIAAQRLGAR